MSAYFVIPIIGLCTFFLGMYVSKVYKKRNIVERKVEFNHKDYNKGFKSALEVFSHLPRGLMWCLVDKEKRIIYSDTKIQESISKIVGTVYLLSVFRSSSIDSAVDIAIQKNEGQQVFDVNLLNAKWDVYIEPHRSTIADYVCIVCVPHDLGNKELYKQEQDYFLQDVAHELRSPLTSIIGFLDLLHVENVQQQDIIERIKKQSHRLNLIVEQMMLLSQNTQKTLNVQKTNLYILMQKLIENMSSRIHEKKIVIECENNNVFADVHEDLLYIAFKNLLDNAINYSPENSKIIIDIKSQKEQEKGFAIINFIDQGEGISSVHIDKIFNRFYRVDSSRARKSGGAGIGLAITKNIVELHGGEVDVKSQIEQGSVFSIKLVEAK